MYYGDSQSYTDDTSVCIVPDTRPVGRPVCRVIRFDSVNNYHM